MNQEIVSTLAYAAASLIGIILLLSFVVLFKQKFTKPTCTAAHTLACQKLEKAAHELSVRLEQLGFQHIADFVLHGLPASEVMQRLWLGPDGATAASFGLVETTIRGQSSTTQVLDFNTDFLPRGNVTTNTYSSPRIMKYRQDKIVANAPKYSVEQLYSLHQKLCREAAFARLTPKPYNVAKPCESIVNDTIQDLEDQVEAGMYRRAKEGGYIPTIYGALRMTTLTLLKLPAMGFRAIANPDEEKLARNARERFLRVRRGEMQPG